MLDGRLDSVEGSRNFWYVDKCLDINELYLSSSSLVLNEKEIKFRFVDDSF